MLVVDNGKEIMIDCHHFVIGILPLHCYSFLIISL